MRSAQASRTSILRIAYARRTIGLKCTVEVRSTCAQPAHNVRPAYAEMFDLRVTYDNGSFMADYKRQEERHSHLLKVKDLDDGDPKGLPQGGAYTYPRRETILRLKVTATGKSTQTQEILGPTMDSKEA